jgi:hypothetical protein
MIAALAPLQTHSEDASLSRFCLISQQSATGIKPGTIRNETGITKSYAPDAVADGVLTPSDDDAVLHDCHLLDDVGQASAAPMKLTVKRTGPSRLSVRLKGSIKNPLVPPAPTVDWDLTLIIDASSSPVKWAISGSHDQFPAFELYVNNQLIYSRDVARPVTFVSIGTGLTSSVFVESVGTLQE